MTCTCEDALTASAPAGSELLYVDYHSCLTPKIAGKQMRITLGDVVALRPALSSTAAATIAAIIVTRIRRYSPTCVRIRVALLDGDGGIWSSEVASGTVAQRVRSVRDGSDEDITKRLYDWLNKTECALDQEAVQEWGRLSDARKDAHRRRRLEATPTRPSPLQQHQYQQQQQQQSL
jgi:hypothetical protein